MYFESFMASSNSEVSFIENGLEFTRVIVRDRGKINDLTKNPSRPYRVYRSPLLKHDVIEWGNEHLIGRWTGVLLDPESSKEAIMLFFELSSDALAFKLGWL